MILADQYRKISALVLALTAFFILLAGRLVDLQVIRYDEFNGYAYSNTVHTIQRMPVRGRILDCRDNPLATSVQVMRVCADPSSLGDHRQLAALTVAPLLRMDFNTVYEKLDPRETVVPAATNLVPARGGVPEHYEIKYKTNFCHYIVLTNKVPMETWEQIQAAMAGLMKEKTEHNTKNQEMVALNFLRYHCILGEPDQIRTYPNHSLASHVIGFVSNAADETGEMGIEKSFNQDLAGIAGWRVTEVDKHARELVDRRSEDVEARDGWNVVLTLDSRVQQIVENEMALGMSKYSPAGMSCTVAQPRTGAILAMASMPNFDPNQPGASPVSAQWNKVISDECEPGSTFKIVVVTGALNEHTVGLNDMFDCGQGKFIYAGHVLHDHTKYGMLSVEDIIAKSSNIGAAEIAIERLGPQRLFEYINRFGFGRPTAIQLPAEGAGVVHPLKKWIQVSMAQIPMGQGVQVTPLQMVMAMSAIANGGLLMQPMLVDHLVSQDGKLRHQYHPQPVRQVATPDAIAEILKALKKVVSPEGTAAGARLEHFTVAGKTGTAQIAEHGAYGSKYYSSFIGFFPADEPELCISVVVDDPHGGHYGGDVAAPIFRNIAEQAANYLNLKPDLSPSVTSGRMLTGGSGPGREMRMVER